MATFVGYSNFKMNGIQLQTYGWNLISTDGVDSLPARRGSNNQTPYQDGDSSFGVKFYQSRVLKFTSGGLPQNSDGKVTAADGPLYHLQNNIDYLKGILHQNSGLQLFSFEVENGVGGQVQREIDVEILASSSIRPFLKNGKQFDIVMTAPRPFWREMPLVTVNQNTITSFPHAFNINTLGNAPINDMVMTIDANASGAAPSLECVSTGDKISITDVGILINDQFIIDLNTKTFTKNTVRADGFISRETAWFMRLPPAASLAMSFDATSGNYDLQLEYYKKWL